MKRIIASVALFLVFGCSTKAPSVSVAETAKESICALESTLAPECKTEAVKTQLAVIKQMVDTQLVVCSAEKDKLRSDKEKSDMLATLLGSIIAAYLVFVLYKKF